MTRSSNDAYELVRLPNGSATIRSRQDGETFHPVAGPEQEATALYVNQLRLRERLAAHQEPLVIWDVGLGGAANPLTALRQTEHTSGRIQFISFDRTTGALEFALKNQAALPYMRGFTDRIRAILNCGKAHFRHGLVEVEWNVILGDFPSLLRSAASSVLAQEPLPFAAPDVLFFDAFSPARNAEMWTLPLWRDLYAIVCNKTCNLATFSRSTIARVTMLLAGFRVGRGETIAGKEETTVAATDATLLDHPLDTNWVARARRSHSAEPLQTAEYTQQPLTPESCAALLRHPQFHDFFRNSN